MMGAWRAAAVSALLAAGADAQEPDVTVEIADMTNIQGPVVWVTLTFDVPIAHNFRVEAELKAGHPDADKLECLSNGVWIPPGLAPGQRAYVRAAEGGSDGTPSDATRAT